MAWGKSTTKTESGVTDSTTDVFTSNKFNQILIDEVWASATVSAQIQLGNTTIDTGTNYAARYSANGVADVTSTSQSYSILSDGNNNASGEGHFYIIYILNLEAEEKLIIANGIDNTNVGAGAVPKRNEVVGKWVNTSNQFDIVNSNNASGGTSDKNISVLGSDLTPAAAVPAIDDVQDNSLFIEKENARRYWFDADSRITSLDGTNNGATTGVTGKIGNAWDFNGAGDYVNIGTSTSDFNFMSSSTALWSVNIWVAFDSVGTNEMIYSTGTGSTAIPQSWMYRDTNNDILTGLTSGVSGTYSLANAATGINIPDTNWHMITLTYDQSLSSNNLKAYKDGALVSQASKTGNVSTNADSNQAMRMFGGVTGVQQDMEGKADEMSIWNRALTSTEITTLYNSGTGVTVTGSGISLTDLKAYYNFEQTGNTLENQLTEKTWTMQPTWRDDFTSDNWVDTGSNIEVNTSTDVIDWDALKTATNSQTAYDLGAGIVSDTNWVLRYDVTVDTRTNTSSSSNVLWTGLFDGASTVDSETAQDHLGMDIIGSTTQALSKFSLTHADGIGLASAGVDNILTNIDTGTWYVELIRESATLLKGNIYSDSTYTTLLASGTRTIVSTVTGLRYIKFVRRNSSASGGTYNGTIDNVKFYNGVTSIN